MKLLEAGCRDLTLSGAVPPGQQPGPPGAQKQLISKGQGGQHDDQPRQGHEDGESHTPSIQRKTHTHTPSSETHTTGPVRFLS